MVDSHAAKASKARDGLTPTAEANAARFVRLDAALESQPDLLRLLPLSLSQLVAASFAMPASMGTGRSNPAMTRAGKGRLTSLCSTTGIGGGAEYKVPPCVRKSHTAGCSRAIRANVGTNSATAGWRKP